MTSQAVAILDFQILFFHIFELNTENGEKTFSVWDLQKCKIRCKVVSISHFFSENSSQHTSCMSCYDDIVKHDVA